MNVLDLFSGIGGFSLGLERAGMRTVAFCEIAPYQRAVLRKHWPAVPIYDDVRELSGQRLWDDGNTVSIQVICGGFPCQDISLAGRGAGISGKQSGLWQEFRRLIQDLRPLYVIAENSPALRTRGADQVLSDLEALDYTCEPFVVGAIHAGAPHRRQRAWLVAYANSAIVRLQQGWSGRPHGILEAVSRDDGAARALADANRAGLEILLPGHAGKLSTAVGAHTWSVEPDVGRVAYGIPNRVDRIRALGNSVVPQIPEIIGRAIMKSCLVASHNQPTGE